MMKPNSASSSGLVALWQLKWSIPSYEQVPKAGFHRLWNPENTTSFLMAGHLGAPRMGVEHVES